MSRTGLFPDPSTRSPTAMSTSSKERWRCSTEVVVAIGTHPGKVPLFSFDERVAMVEDLSSCCPRRRAGFYRRL